jgi:hypothetical protein
MRTSRMPAAYTLPALALALSLSIPAEAGFTRLGRGGSSRDSGPAVRGTLKQPYVDAKGRRYYTDEKGRVRRLR